jgi:hypothetical protein
MRAFLDAGLIVRRESRQKNAETLGAHAARSPLSLRPSMVLDRKFLDGAQVKMVFIERIKARLRNARARGKRLGRPEKIVDHTRIGRLREQGVSWRKIARQMECSARTVRRAGQKATCEGFCPTVDKNPDLGWPQATDNADTHPRLSCVAKTGDLSVIITPNRKSL